MEKIIATKVENIDPAITENTVAKFNAAMAEMCPMTDGERAEVEATWEAIFSALDD
ncbi:hypothetical protein LO749_01455 [Paracoccus denitrificans]|uniref:hypothetical protein n=1 Tax=Paracoccus denitrificans TaxID=266 RepID=UPI001E62E497|nr:hypothetical protein [Paracoccus denitrificans]UFS65261.1 hypothetical protein LO749_01455 [Paracoccus denitrificans]